ncbi:ComF family protein [Allostreptomyces psammosilenae]|uniref:Putative amidophosphoribosyltransferase n=1 Tax=Allostreptomyces psammosilenae TaxID=1892865 RepID=A0A852ZUW6_9ACTN|nr:ComF family protein [Allostreptomyces psammosilenae]NYI06176.1 putative amidophosphoribosyltransferase [Allostreptomyces psammosilenae]
MSLYAVVEQLRGLALAPVSPSAVTAWRAGAADAGPPGVALGPPAPLGGASGRPSGGWSSIREAAGDHSLRAVTGVREWIERRTRRVGGCLAGLWLPASCHGCGGRDGPVCVECQGLLCRPPLRVVLETAGAGGHDSPEPAHAAPAPHPAGPRWLPVYGAGEYTGPLRQMLLAHKERGALGLCAVLGEAVAGCVVAAAEGGTSPGLPGSRGAPASRGPGVSSGRAGPHTEADTLLLVPVPSARAAVRARGHDPVRRMTARAAAVAARFRRDCGPPASPGAVNGPARVRVRVAPVLRQVRPMADQSGLTAEERWANARGAFAVAPRARRRLAGAPVVLVDDVATTGASLIEAARAVAAAGGLPVAGAVLAMSGRLARAGGAASPDR